MDGRVGISSSRNASNLAALADLLPKPRLGSEAPTNKNSDQDAGGSQVGGRLQLDPPAHGGVGSAGDPRRKGFGGADSSSKASLSLKNLIVKQGTVGETPTGAQEAEAVLGELEEKGLDSPASLERASQESEVEAPEQPPRASSAISPLRKLIRSQWDRITSPWRRPLAALAPPLPPPLHEGHVGRNRRVRKGLLKGAAPGYFKAKKNSQALIMARKLAVANPSKFPIEEEFDADSAKKAKNAKRDTLEKLLTSLKGKGAAYPLTGVSVKGLASVLKLAGYKAGSNYMAEAKLVHIELGYSWTSLLDRVLSQCKRALDRGRGPKKKAPEVPGEKWERPPWAPATAANRSVKFAKETFIFAMIWLLREIELSNMTTSDVLLDFINKKVTLTWRSSKTDQESKGVTRVLQCLCGPACSLSCPFRASKELVERAERVNGTSSPLCLDRSGGAASKHLIIKAWCTVFNCKVTGHSARRTGALRYARLGWAVSQIAYLGRWKSNVVYSYAEEALALVAVNVGVDYQRDKPVVDTETGETSEDWKSVLKKELKNFKSKVSQEVKASKDMVIFWKDLFEKNAGNLPPMVLSSSSKTVHFNVQCPFSSPPITWKTACGWRYYGSSFNFSNVDKVTCSKCLQLCAS